MPPKSHDPGRHVRVGRGHRPRPRLMGVAALLERQRGETHLAYACLEGQVLVSFGWRLTDAELADVDAAAQARAGSPWEQVMEAIGDVFRRDVTFRLASLEEVEG